MSKKTLLNESQIRQFMKLAKLEPLTPGFVQGLTENTKELEERGMMRMRDEDDDLEEGRGMRMRDEDEMDEMRMRGDAMMRDEDEMDEVRTGLGPDYDLTRPKRGHGRGTGAADGLEEQEEMEVDAAEMEDAAGDEMEMDAEMEAPAAEAGKMVSVDDFLSALERALEDAMGEEVEIDSDEVADDEPADAMADEPEGADEMGDDDALMESITKRVAKRILMEALSTKK